MLIQAGVSDMARKNVYDVMFEPVKEVSNPVVDGEEGEYVVPRSRLNGVIVKNIKEAHMIHLPPDYDTSDVAQSWYEWFKLMVEDGRELFEENFDGEDDYIRISKADVEDSIEILFENRGEIKDEFLDKVNIKDEKGGEENKDGSGSGGDGSEDSSDEDGYGGKFSNLQEVGILTDNLNPDRGKIKGAMLKFAKEVDAVEAPSEEPNYEDAKEAFNLFMQDKFGNEWVLFLTEFLEPGQLRSDAEWMFNNNDKYRALIGDKWEYKPGNSKEGGESEGKQDQQSAASSNKGSLEYWNNNGNSESFTLSKFQVNFGHDDSSVDSDSDSGSSSDPNSLEHWTSQEEDSEDEVDDEDEDDTGPSSYQSDRFRLKKFREIKADSGEMWDIEDIRNEIIRENVWTAMEKIPTNSVDCVVTSPPYWALRDYDDGEFAPIGGDPDCDHRFNGGECYKCGAWRGQLGHEPDPSMFVENIVAIFEKIGRILKPTGSVFLNIGDTYASEKVRGEYRVERKSMIGIPYRIYLQMMEQGWVMRNPITWVKQILLNDDDIIGAANPTSVQDRINHTFEPMWWFANSEDYYADIFSVRREHKTDVDEIEVDESKFDSDEISEEDHNSITARAAREGYTPSLQHDDGANIPDAWRIPTGKAGDEHPAVFSPELVKRPIKMGCPKWVCDNCGKPYRRVTENGEHKEWEQTCSCSNADKRRGIVFEPFCGRGTTPKAAQDLDRDWITTEVSDKYADFAEDYIDGGKEKRLTEFM